MKNLLFFIGILCILASCKKNYVEPITYQQTTDSTNYTQPTFAYITRSNEQNETVYRFSYYPNGLLKKLIKYDSISNPNQKDSTLYIYNANNKVIETSEYSGGNLKYKTETVYDYTGNIKTISKHDAVNPQYSITYQYMYTSATDVAYVLGYDATNTIIDSIFIDDNIMYHYRKPLDVRDATINGYYIQYYNPLHLFVTPSGAFYDVGVRNPNHPNADSRGYVYNDASWQPTFLNKDIPFQYEVAVKFLNVGIFKEFPERNYYITTGPRQYFLCNGPAGGGRSSGNGPNYTFNQNDQLIKIVTGFDYYNRGGSAIPGYEIVIMRYE